ncbi:MAG TPA: cupin domain-containing protein [Abditibacteriaceae bacterium]|jgi:quercetin dioxygenase-like cupin family protein
MTETQGRLRPHPTERFAGATHFFDLRSTLELLRAEAHQASSGHRQQAIFHRGSVTQVLFAFGPGSGLPQHTANGLVTIQALDGCLQVQAGDETYNLTTGQMVVLNPSVQHSVHAAEESAMLLTVHLEENH